MGEQNKEVLRRTAELLHELRQFSSFDSVLCDVENEGNLLYRGQVMETCIMNDILDQFEELVGSIK